MKRQIELIDTTALKKIARIFFIAMHLLCIANSASAVFPAKAVSGYGIPGNYWAQIIAPQPSIIEAQIAYCKRVYGETILGKVNWSPTYWWGPGMLCNQPSAYYADSWFSWMTAYFCPETATKTGSTCNCNAGYLQNAENNGCYQNEVIEEPANTKTSEQSDKDPCLGNSIYPLRGSKKEIVNTGVSIGGVSLTLTYDSSRHSAAALAGVAPKDYGDAPALGGYWFSSLHRRVKISPGRFGVNLFRGDGSVLSFRYESGSYVSDADVTGRFSKTTQGYQFIDASRHSIETYDRDGKLLSIADTQGNQLSFTYSTEAGRHALAAGYLMAVSDSRGRKLRFEYELPAGGVAAIDGRIKRIVSPTGQVITATYGGNDNLVALQWENGTSRQFVYENQTLPWALTGVIDENNSRLSTFEYDGAGRAVATERAGGVGRYSVSYRDAPTLNSIAILDETRKITLRRSEWVAPSEVVLALPSGQTASMGAATVQGVPVMTSMSQSAGSGCAASSNLASFDTRGNALSRDDFRGQRTCYVYDSANRETVRVEGLASGVGCASVTPTGASLPAGARKITTSWHPDWRKPIQVSEPARRTTTIYHGQPDPFNGNALANCTAASPLPDGKSIPLICKQVEQALLGDGSIDAGVPAKVSSFTYNAQGGVLSASDANGKVSNYSYYATTSFTGNPAGSFDPHYETVTLLLRGNGVAGSQAIIDEGPNQLSVSANGNAQISSAQSQFGGSSIAFDGTGDYLVLPYNPNFAFGSGDFTLETFLYKNANNPNSSRVWNANGDYVDGVALHIDPNGNFGVYLSATSLNWDYSLSVVANLANGQWHHLAVVRSGGTVYAFINGIRYTVTTTLGTAALYSNAGYARVIGGQAGVDRSLNGYIDDFRITKGVARYTANFTPPTAEFPNHGLILSPHDVGHTAGDLQSITNAAGHVTQFTQYDRVGRVRQMIDPKGVVTDITYTPRGWVRTVTTTAPGASARTTSYSYDGVGQLTGVSQPDGSSLSYSYDAAHRLVGVTDAKGNSISYTLDNAGNKTAEEIKDPSGVLQRSISRSYDALNRVQQVTGAAQ